MSDPSNPRDELWRALRVLVVVCVVTGVVTVAAIPPSGSFFWVIRVIYDGGTLVLPALLLGVAAVSLARGAPLGRRAAGAFAALAVSAVLTRVYATHVEPRALQVHEVTIETDKVAREVRILHLSDIQTDHVGDYEAEALARAASLRPDLVLHTGDLLQLDDLARLPAEYAALAPLLDAIPAPLGRLNVVGDTDWRLIETLRATRTPLHTLEDTAVEIPLDPANPAAKLRVLGLRLETARDLPRARRLIEAFAAEDPASFDIVMGHAPDFILEAQDLGIELHLAGHTHGGQIRVPFIGPLVTLSRVPRAWARGYRELGGTRLNVSAGIGAEHAAGLPSIRLNCPPEMTLIVLEPKPRG